MGLFAKIFGTYSSRQIKKIKRIADRIEALAPEYENMSNEELSAVTGKLKKRLEDGETLNDILCDAFAAVREADARVLGKRPFYVQVLGGILLHQGRIAEMKTGEGKTLVATMPAYLNALSGKGVHVVTVNDYLARRDSEEMALWVFPRVWSCTALRRRKRRLPIRQTLPTAPITNSDLTICVTIWSFTRTIWCSVGTCSPSWTRWTRS